MKKPPKPYAESTLKRMHKKLNLYSETEQLLYDYFDAFSNFYEILPLKEAYEIINRYDNGLVTEEEFVAFSEIVRHEERYFFIVGKDEMYTDVSEQKPIERDIVHESLLCVDSDLYYEMIEDQYGKPLYIPTRSELLKYKDDLYVEKNSYFTKLERFFENKLKIDSTVADELACECICLIRTGGYYLDIFFETLDRMRIKVSERNAEELVELIGDVHNNTRLPSNRGYTPNELAAKRGGSRMPEAITFGPNMRASFEKGELDVDQFRQGFIESELPEHLKIGMLKELSDIARGDSETRRIGRNDPCPCGSGKKYKKCCGRSS